ncbi:MAG TPA: hypothetical protein PK683_14735, partial [Leptospiraceae bacterium]|nr:hypothetical protein [Leptospiraceae bacterium]
MKKILFISLLSFLISGAVSAVSASAVITCKIKAKVIREIPNNTDDPKLHKLEIAVIESTFDGGHSAGENCSKDRFSLETEISFRAKKRMTYKPNDIIEIYHTTVYNMTEKGRNVYRK